MENDVLKLISYYKTFNSELMELNIKYEEEIESLNRIIDELKELVIALWHNDKARFLNKEQIDLLDNTVFGNDEDLGSDKE